MNGLTCNRGSVIGIKTGMTSDHMSMFMKPPRGSSYMLIP